MFSSTPAADQRRRRECDAVVGHHHHQCVVVPGGVTYQIEESNELAVDIAGLQHVGLVRQIDDLLVITPISLAVSPDLARVAQTVRARRAREMRVEGVEESKGVWPDCLQRVEERLVDGSLAVSVSRVGRIGSRLAQTEARPGTVEWW